MHETSAHAAASASHPAGRTAVVAGASGLTGTQLLNLMQGSGDYTQIIALTRRPIRVPDSRYQIRNADFSALPDVLADIGGPALDVYCCLGATIAKAGSEAAFRTVDVDHVVALAQWAKRAGAHRFFLVSSLGADAGSRVFYNRIKGEAEDLVRSSGPVSLVILQPSLLDGIHHEFRLGPRLILAATRPFRALIPAALRPVAARDVAASMLLAARNPDPPAVIASAAMHGAAQLLAKQPSHPV